MEESKNVTICAECIKSSFHGNKCKYEDSNKMALCPTFLKKKPRK